MRALFIQQDHVSPVGHVGAQFAARGYDVDELLVVSADRFETPNVTVEFPDPTAYDAIVPMGAKWSVYDGESIGSWVRPELDYLRAAHGAGVPILGICFGGQALAAALGGSVEPSAQAEIGWYTVETSEPELVEPGPWFEWHSDRWVAPPGARVIARTALAEQAFVVGQSLGVQFHPELTPSMLDGWLANGGREYLDGGGYDIEQLRKETAATADAAEQRARRLVDRFVDQVAGASSRRPSIPTVTT